MGILCNFHFCSFSNIDGNEERIEFDARGYKKEENGNIIYYFKYDNSYKFIIQKDILKVEVNNSKYVFNVDKTTSGSINNMGYSMSTMINTDLLNISENRIEIKYEMIFDNFKGKYQIILELY